MTYLDSFDDSSEPAMDPNTLMGPGAVDQQIRQALSCCWMMMPHDKKTVTNVEKEFRRLVDRALKDIRDDASTFGSSDVE